MNPIGSSNSAPTFLAMTMKLQKKWDTLSKERDLKYVPSKIIVNDLLLYGHTAENILGYFEQFWYF